MCSGVTYMVCWRKASVLTALQMRIAVTVYRSSKQLLLFSYTPQTSGVLWLGGFEQIVSFIVCCQRDNFLPLVLKRTYLPPYKVADTSFSIPEGGLVALGIIFSLLRPGSPAVTSQTGSLSQWGRSSVTGRRRPQGYHIDNAVCITLINAPQDVTPVLSGFLFSEGCSPFVPLPTALPSGLQSVCVHLIAITGCIHYKSAI